MSAPACEQRNLRHRGRSADADRFATTTLSFRLRRSPVRRTSEPNPCRLGCPPPGGPTDGRAAHRNRAGTGSVPCTHEHGNWRPRPSVGLRHAPTKFATTGLRLTYRHRSKTTFIAHVDMAMRLASDTCPSLKFCYSMLMIWLSTAQAFAKAASANLPWRCGLAPRARQSNDLG